MARLPKYLNMSAAGRAKLALPTARLALVAFSCTLAVVGMGAFVATLPGLSASEPAAAASVDGGKGGSASVPAAEGDQTQEGEGAAEGDVTEGDASEGADAGASAAMGTSPSAGTTLVAPGSSAAGASSAGSSASDAGSGSGSSGSASGGSSAGGSHSGGSGSSSGGSSSGGSGSSSGEGSIDHSDPFNAIPTEADEAEFHNFLVTWYNRLASAEADAAARNSDSADAGFVAVSNRVRSNYSKWCGAQENLIGAYRCLYDYACTGSESDYDEYLSWKSRVSL